MKATPKPGQIPVEFIHAQSQINPMSTDHDSPFGAAIYAHTRKQAVADGQQVEVSALATQAGIRFPVFLTRTVYDQFVTVPDGVEAQDETGRLWDILTMLRHAIRTAQPGRSRLSFALYVRNDNRTPKLVKLSATCGPLDMPVITAMLPGGA